MCRRCRRSAERFAGLAISDMPGVLAGGALEVLDDAAEGIILGRGVEQALPVPEATLDALRTSGTVALLLVPTPEAIQHYLLLQATRRIGALLPSAC